MNNSQAMLGRIWQALGGPANYVAKVRETGEGSLSSAFAVTDFATASTAAAGLALAEFSSACGAPGADVTVDRRLSSLWFSKSIRPLGWSLPPQWDSVAGDYEARDGWIRLHTNAPHHRKAALTVLGVEEDRARVAAAVIRWSAADLESAIVAANGCAAQMRSLDDWRMHPQAVAVSAEPLVGKASTGPRQTSGATFRRERPLAGVRVLDLTRVLAGPVATRFLAGYGAEVLRIDPPGWDEPAVLPEVTLGKRRARLDLRTPQDRGTFEALIARADVLVHGYRSDALAGLGYDANRIDKISPGLVDVALDAYGWSGPWAGRRGFDSLVQMSTGLAERGMRLSGGAKPTPLPVQALDYGTGCLMAAAALRGLTGRTLSGHGVRARASLARTAAFLAEYQTEFREGGLTPEADADLSGAVEETSWGPAHRLKPPVSVSGAPMAWTLPAGPLGDSPAVFAP
ncbi:MAG: CoA transferase [Beijerinckiaceae bacterium]|nr:CoA transferase [Beijerinckiaceae bacterium]